ncbi:helix-turn-helix domain-containing protein [Nonomuraea sp. NN258]|nr:helix-turn-helix domain-containing protein [Nonomuraea antri]
MGSVAGAVGLSAPRLRALARAELGVPLARLRRWARLRAAIACLPGHPVADAAAMAGFADQAHLARTARDLIGRTPSSIGGRPDAFTNTGPERSEAGSYHRDMGQSVGPRAAAPVVP